MYLYFFSRPPSLFFSLLPTLLGLLIIGAAAAARGGGVHVEGDAWKVVVTLSSLVELSCGALSRSCGGVITARGKQKPKSAAPAALFTPEMRRV